ncbi:MAG TPA: 3-methyl-2-oxobutanoate hydroxymethyltransferase [Chitinivibrionales bacterium]|jgi:3-methyl-2-oxobutanoate hydroxymethyltransferase|nr:3-methyl-2-oxobutanoate hydroxymethyltransferase [Chitinivibrionales bacterium]
MKKTARSFIQQKAAASPITMLTAYDCPTARMLDECGVDVVLVGDSVGDTVLGYKNIKDVTMDDMAHHTAAVARGVKNALVIGDMPYRSYATPATALVNARRLVKCGAHAVKMEGGTKLVPIVRSLRRNRISVCGHLGYLPQSAPQPRVVGKTIAEATTLVADALALQDAGVFMIVLELIPAELARAVSKLLHIPTIGIGAGPHCDGQVQVFHDMAGLSPTVFRHVKVFSKGKETLSAGVSQYVKEVTAGTFPTNQNVSSMAEDVAEELEKWIYQEFK